MRTDLVDKINLKKPDACALAAALCQVQKYE